MADQPSSFSQGFQWAPDTALLADLRRLMAVLDALLLPAVQSKADYDTTVESLRQVILTRFNTTIQPIFDSIAANARLGAILSTTSVSTVTADLGSRAFICKNGPQFAPAAYLMAQSVDTPGTMLFGNLVSYDPDSGSLVINVSTVLGTIGLSRGNWRITAAATPQFLVSPDLFNAYSKSQTDTLIASGDAGVTTAMQNAIDQLRAAIVAVNTTQDNQISGLTGGVNANATAITNLQTAMTAANNAITAAQNSISAVSGRVDGILANVDTNYNTLRKISDALSTAGGGLSYTSQQSLSLPQKKQLIQNADLLLNTADCKLLWDTNTAIRLVPSDSGDKIFINGNFYKVPAAGVTIAPAGTANSIRAVYYNGSVLGLSDTQPTRSTTWGYWALPSDDSWRHVGDVLVFSGPNFYDYFVCSRFNRVERERMSAFVSGQTQSGSPVIANSNWTIGMVAAVGEDCITEFFGGMFSNANYDGTQSQHYAQMVVNGATNTGNYTSAPSNTSAYTPGYCKHRIKATSTQAFTGTMAMMTKDTNFSAMAQGVVTTKTRQ